MKLCRELYRRAALVRPIGSRKPIGRIRCSVLKIAVCQLPLNIEAPEENLRLATSTIREAARLGAKLIVLPELTNSGYVFAEIAELTARATTLDGPVVKEWSALAHELGITIVGGLAIAEGGKFFNTSVIVDETGLRGSYRKVHFWNDEPDFFTPGTDEPLVVDTKFGRLATMVCYDLEFTEWVRLAMLADAVILAIPTNWPDGGLSTDPTPMESVRVQAAASQNKLVIAAADRTGTERGVRWSSASVIADCDGVIRAISDRNRLNEMQILIADVEIPTDRKVGPRNDVRSDRRPELYGKVLRK
jgi:predicted amidohydrolase